MDAAAVNTQIGANLQALRREAGHSQQDVAALFGLTYQQMQKYEKGRSRVPASMLAKLHLFYEVPYAAFFSGLEEKPDEDGSTPGRNDNITLKICRHVNGISDTALKARIEKIVAILAT